MKLRPVLVLTTPIGSIPEVLVAYISSAIPERLLGSDLVIDLSQSQFRSTHLKVTSALRLHKLVTLHGASLLRRLGRLEPAEHEQISLKLRALLKL